MPNFIKKIPVRDRPKFIQEYLGEITGSKYICTDYTAFETHFTKEVMMACEMILYKHCLSKLGNAGATMYKVIEHVLTGTNTLLSKCFKISVEATRMSGEMNTSLGNGFSNLMFALAMIGYKNKIPINQFDYKNSVRNVVEGDDQVLKTTLNTPSTQDIKGYGFMIKLDEYDNLGETSFCGIVAHEDDPNFATICDPIPALISYCWINRKYSGTNDRYVNGLYKCKALSLLYQYAGCPMIQSFARHELDRLESYEMKFYSTNSYDDEMTREAITWFNEHGTQIIPIHDATRELMAKKFLVHIDDQINFEKSCQIGKPDFDLIWKYVKNDTIDYTNKYLYEDRSCSNSYLKRYKKTSSSPQSFIKFRYGDKVSRRYG